MLPMYYKLLMYVRNDPTFLHKKKKKTIGCSKFLKKI